MRFVTTILLFVSFAVHGQSPARIGVIASSVSKYDADAQNYFNRLTAAGYTPSTTDKTQVNTLILDLKAAGTWVKYYDIWIFVWANAAANAVPLKGVAPNVVWTGSITHAAGGITSDGSTGYGNLGVSPSTALALNNGFISAYVRTDASTGVALGVTQSQRIALFARNSTNVLGDFYNRLTAASTNARAYWVVNRSASNDLRVYKNGVQVGSTLTSTGSTTVATSTYPFFVLAMNNENSTVSNFSTQTVAKVALGTPAFTATEVTNSNTAWEAFFDARGIGIQ